MLINNLNITPGDNEEKLQRCQEYVDALEEERRKIQVFERELPLCLELVTRAIEACKHQITSGATEYHFVGQSECSEQTSSEGPVLEEFIPIKRASHSSDEEKLSKRIKNNCTEIDSNISDSKINDNKESKKSDWLRSVQLWNQSPDPTCKEDTPKKVQVVEVKRDGSGGAFHPFKREKSVGTSSTSTKEKSDNGGDGGSKVAATSDKVAAASPRVETGGNNGGGGGGGECNKKEEKEGESQRKQRRCWSAELHKRFLQALQQLGGSHVATPKQIRELMKVDGLTNDEVKSHLQKYRLHTRRPTPSMHNNNTQQTPQFVVVGGIWVPPPEYSALAHTPSPTGEASTAAIPPNGVYAPIASHPSNASMPSKQRHHQHDHGNGNHSEGRCASHSPATSSSDTTTASPSAC